MRPGLRMAVLQRDGHVCVYCGRAAPEVVLHVDHVRPKSVGGSDAMENLVAACADCNQGKGSAVFPGEVRPWAIPGAVEFCLFFWSGDDPPAYSEVVRLVRSVGVSETVGRFAQGVR